MGYWKCFTKGLTPLVTRSKVTLDQHVRVRCMSLGSFTRSVTVSGDDLELPTEDERSKSLQSIDKFKAFCKAAKEGGGPRGYERHVKKNKKMLVRDRISNIIDSGTEFFELGEIAGFEMPYGDVPCGGVVCGIGRVRGVYCMISGNDATVQAGTYFPITLKKSLRSQEIAELNRLPTIYLPDSGGAFLPLQAQIFLQGGRSFYNQAVMSSKGIYQVALVCGSCTAGGAYNPTMSDEAIVVDRIAKIFLGGPPLVKAALGEVVSDEDLGGAFMHSSVSGCTDYFASTEEESFEMCRDVIESLNMSPEAVLDSKKVSEPEMPFPDILGKEVFDKVDVYGIIGSIVDGSKFHEFKAFYGPDLIAGTAYIQGMMVGIVANCGEILSREALTASHFLNMCNKRRIPVVFLQNSSPNPGQVEGTDLRDRGKLSATIAGIDVPKIAVTISACLRDDNVLMCGPGFQPSFNFTWPNCKFSAPDLTFYEEAEEKYEAFDACHNLLVDSMILPQSTRQVLGSALRILGQQYNQPENVTKPLPILRM